MLRRAFATLLAVGLAANLGAAGIGADVKTALEKEKHIYVSTRRESGEWSDAVPIWFTYDGDAIYFTTSPSSHKAKRIARGSPVRIRVGSADGPELEGTATVITEPKTIERMGEAYRKKYWIAWFGLFQPRPGRVASGKTIAVKVIPVGGKEMPGT